MKVIFLQINGRSFGGVWQVNRTVGEALINKGYDVSVISLRNNPTELEVEHDKRLKIKTINTKDLWATYRFSDLKTVFKKGKIFTFVKMAISRIKYEITLKKDIKVLQKLICDQKPDRIITTQYQILDMMPKDYLKFTTHEQHSDFISAYEHNATRKTLLKYNGKISYLWLTKSTMQHAIDKGFLHNHFIYNAVRFECNEIADVENNKKLVTICRLSKQKNISLMIDIVEEVFKNEKFKGWILEIYGDGPLEKQLKAKITNTEQIRLMGRTNYPKRVLLSSSINLNTSLFEGFAMSILEANECGVPTISLNFGESVYEQILNGKTGIICKDKEDYISKLKELMNNKEQLKYLSKQCKNYSSNFHIDKIVEEWIKYLQSDFD